jgi:uncharacterized RDD family membrane protein YckC
MKNDGILSLENRLAQQIGIQKDFNGQPSQFTKPPWKVILRRFFAFLIDAAVLKAIGIVITWAFGAKLMFMRMNGWWIGLAIITIYFSILDSFIGQGKTLGKRIADIEVVRIDGEFLNPFDAFLRYVPLGIVATIFAFSANENVFSPMIAGLRFLSIVIAIAIASFAIFHPQRRSIHDLLLDTAVIRSGSSFKVEGASLKKPLMAFIVATTLIAGPYLSLNAFFILHPKEKKTRELWKMFSIRSDLSNPKVMRSFSYDLKKRELLPTLEIEAYISNPANVQKPGIADSIMRDLWQSAVMSGNVFESARRIDVTLWSGYDLGIGGLKFISKKSFPYAKDLAGEGKKHRYKTFPARPRSIP